MKRLYNNFKKKLLGKSQIKIQEKIISICTLYLFVFSICICPFTMSQNVEKSPFWQDNALFAYLRLKLMGFLNFSRGGFPK